MEHADTPMRFDAGNYAADNATPTKKKRSSRSKKATVSTAGGANAAVDQSLMPENAAPENAASIEQPPTELAAELAVEPVVESIIEPTVEPIAETALPASVEAAAAEVFIAPEDVHVRIGQLTRTLHDALRELGYDRELAGTRDQLPDARERLAYIARVTGEAAEKVLNAVDRARSVQVELTEKAGSLRTRWQAVASYTANDSTRATPAGRQLVDETCAFFASIGGQTDATQTILTDIMMAQDFHDLTGQVIRKVVNLANNMEEQLLKLLLETTPPEQRRKVENEIAQIKTTEQLEGPIVKADGRDDVVADQAGVDDLLASLGF